MYVLASPTSCGGVFVCGPSLPIGHLCTVEADSSGRASFQLASEQLKVWEVIGRAMVLHGHPEPQEDQRFVRGKVAG